MADTPLTKQLRMLRKRHHYTQKKVSAMIQRQIRTALETPRFLQLANAINPTTRKITPIKGVIS